MIDINNIPKLKFKRDAYMKKRGTPAMLVITCAQCQRYLMCYQKDGPGPLLRCYLDRIHHPEYLENRQHETLDVHMASKLKCQGCEVVIGSPIIYEKENRLAYHMRPGFFHRKKNKDLAV